MLTKSALQCWSLLILTGVSSAYIMPVLKIAWSENSTGPLIRARTSVAPDRKISVNNIILRYYNGSSVEDVVSVELPDAARLLDTPGFARDSPTVVYIHGYIELFTDESVTTVVSAYLRAKPEHNVIVLDWSNMAYGQYFAAAKNVKKVGSATARQLVRLSRGPGGLSLGRLHVVGHSLGAHVAGHIGRSLRQAGQTLPRISALDPAFPGFYPALLAAPLRRSDAKLVDAVHTDAGGYGAPLGDAHAHFWPNGGVAKQPGCSAVTLFFSLEDFCSHHRSWRFWAESVLRPGSFPARRCTDYASYTRGDCYDDENTPHMGHDAANNLRGDYYLTTNAESPFSRSQNEM